MGFGDTVFVDAPKSTKPAVSGQHDDTGGLLGVLKEAPHLVKDAPGGIAHFVGNAFVDPAGGAILGASIGAPFAGVGAGVGAAVGGAIGGVGDVVRHIFDPSAPWSETIEGFKETGKHLLHPSSYATAYEHGHLLSQLVGDIGNLSIVGGAASKAFGAATGTAAVKAAAAEAYQAEAAAYAARDAFSVADDAYRATISEGGTPDPVRAAQIADLGNAADAAETHAATVRAAADTAAADTARAQRFQNRMDAIIHGAERGAFAPFVPWTVAKRLLVGGEGFDLLSGTRPVAAASRIAEEGGVLGRATERVAGLTPSETGTRRGAAKNLAVRGAQELVDRGILGAEAVAVREARRQSKNEIDQFRSRLRFAKEETSHVAQDTLAHLQDIFPDEVDQTVANFARNSVANDGWLSAIAVLRERPDAASHAAVNAMLDALAESTAPAEDQIPHYRAAIDRLVDVFDPAKAADPDTIAYREKLAEYDRVMRSGLFGQREQMWYSNIGHPADHPAEYYEWQRTGTTPYGPALEQVAAKHLRTLDKLLQERRKQEARLARLMERRNLPEGVTYEEVADRIRSAAYGIAHDILHSSPEREFVATLGEMSDEAAAAAYQEYLASISERRAQLATSSDKVLARIGRTASETVGHQIPVKATHDLATRIVQMWRNGTVDPIGQHLVDQFVDRAGAVTAVPTEMVTGGPGARRAYDAAVAAGRSDAEARVAAAAAEHAQRMNERLASMVDRGYTPAQARRELNRIEKYARRYDEARVSARKYKANISEAKPTTRTEVRNWVMGERRAIIDGLRRAASEIGDPRTHGEQPQRSPATVWSDIQQKFVPNVSAEHEAYLDALRLYGLEPSDFAPPRVKGTIGRNTKRGITTQPHYESNLDSWAHAYGAQESLPTADVTYEGTAEKGSPVEISLRHWAQRVIAYKETVGPIRGLLTNGLENHWNNNFIAEYLYNLTGDATVDARQNNWFLEGNINDVVDHIMSGDMTPAERAALPSDLLTYDPMSERIRRVSDAVNADNLAEIERGLTGTFDRPARAALPKEDHAIYDLAVAKLQEEGYGRQRIASRERVLQAVGESQKAARVEGRAEGEMSVAEKIARTEGRRADADRIKAGNIIDANGQMMNDVVAASERAGYRLGKVDKEIMQVRQKLGWNQRAIDKVDQSMADAIDKAGRDVANAPAVFKDALRINRVASESLLAIAEELDNAGVKAGAAEVRAQAGAIAITLADLVAANPEFRPVHVVGGVSPESLDVRPGTRESAQGAIPTKRRVRSLRQRTGIHTEATAELLVKRTLQDMHAMLHNQFVDLAGSVIGTYVTDHPELAQHLADWHAAKEAYRATEEGHRISDRSRMEDAAAKMATWMAGEGYLAWDPETRSNHGIMSIEQFAQNPENVVFLPERAIRRFHRDSMVSPLGPNSEAFLRKYYDTPQRVWKNAVLALRPAWQVGNIFGNMTMAMVGGGIDPVTYIRRIRQAFGVLQQVSLSELVDRYGLSEAQMMALNEGRVPTELFRRGSMISERQMLGRTTRFGLAGWREAIRHPIEWSYEANGLFDDLNRLAIFLERMERGYTPEEVARYRDKYPDLAGRIDAIHPETLERFQVSGGETNPYRGVYKEMAIREALNIAGDFTRLTPVERYVIRRIIPFYPFLKHMTRLTWELSSRHPLRIAWMMNLGRLANNDSDAPLLWGAIKLPGGGYLRLPHVNPFADITDTFDINPTTGEPSAMGLLGAVSPLITNVAVGLGMPEPRSGAFLNMPPGEASYDAYGRPAAHPLFLHPIQFANYIARQFPQAQDLIEGLPDLLFGHKPVLRYSTGEPLRSRGETILANQYGWNPFGGSQLPARLQFLGPLATQSGIPTIQNIDAQGIIDRANARIARNKASERRYLTGTGG